jgi:V/A-type H+-transporting ATPase subunit C
MQGINYAYSVTSVRIKEASFLTASDLEQMMRLSSVDAIVSFLGTRGWPVPKEHSEIARILREELLSVWNFLTEIAPDIQILQPLILRKDYHNLKAAIKSSLSGAEIDKYYLAPSTIQTDLITEAVKKRTFNILPASFAAVGEEAYDVLVRTGDGQLADIIIDRAALDAIHLSAKKTKNDMMIRVQELFCAAANIKTAYRAARMHKSKNFLERAISSLDSLDRDALIEAAAESDEALLKMLSQTEYAPGVEILADSPASFEKWCDDRAMQMTDPVKYMYFGPEPLIAYYMTKEAEIKNIRILLTAAENNIPFEDVTDRLRRIHE